MTSDCVHSFISHIFRHITVRSVGVVSPPFLSSSEGKLSTPGDFPALGLCTASSTSSFGTGRLSACCVGVWLLWSRQVSGWSLQFYRSLQYSVHWFRTAVLSVRMFRLLSSMTADLYCWLLVRMLLALGAEGILSNIIPVSMLLHCSSIHSSFAAFIFLLTSLLHFSAL